MSKGVSTAMANAALLYAIIKHFVGHHVHFICEVVAHWRCH